MLLLRISYSVEPFAFVSEPNSPPLYLVAQTHFQNLYEFPQTISGPFPNYNIFYTNVFVF